MAEPLWLVEDAVSITAGALLGQMAGPITGVSIDSRTLTPGDLFIAVRGDTLDGHDYVGKAIEAGAACAVVSEAFKPADEAWPLLCVKDTLKAMEALGQAARARTQARIIAVTGSVGKTSTKEALRLALSESSTTHASDKSYNNHWGVPLSLARMPKKTQFGVFEVGMNHPGEIIPLSDMIRPHIAIITTVAPVHLGFFESVEEIADAKAEIFSGLEPGGTAILNRDNPHFALLKAHAERNDARIVSFGADPEAEVRLDDVVLEADRSKVRATISGTPVAYELGAPGRHLVMNSLAVLAAVNVADADLSEAAHALAKLRAQKGRGERVVMQVPGGAVTIIDESYNANPASIQAALAALAQTPRSAFPRRIAVLGDMLELGRYASDLHQALAEPIEEAEIDTIFACGPHMRTLYDALPNRCKGGYAESSEGLKTELLRYVQAGDVIMIKGSLGSRMGPLVDALKTHLGAYEIEKTAGV